MTRHYGIHRHDLPPTVDRRARRRVWIMIGIASLLFYGLAAVIVLKLTGVVE